MAAILQTTFSNSIYCTETCFQWSQLTVLVQTVAWHRTSDNESIPLTHIRH